METKRIVTALLVQLSVVQLSSSAVIGGCGEWGEWSSCSRTCGPAISTQQRNCSSGSACGNIDVQLQFRSCPNRPCGEDVDMRVELCSSFDDGNVTFSPHDNEGECLLACKSTTPDGHVTVRGPLQALPGTRCTTVTGDSGVCVNSLCAPVGCDGVLGSRKAIDKCGRCITPDETCTRNSGTKTQDPVIGQVEMVVLPAGASSISITNNLPPHRASLMVQSMEGDYLFTVGEPGLRFTAGEAEFLYSVEVDGGSYREILTSQGTLNQSVIIEVYIPSQRVAPSVSYEYYKVVNRRQSDVKERAFLSGRDNFHWVYGAFLPCTHTCTTGVQVAYALCKDPLFNRILPDTYCSSTRPLPILRQCCSAVCAPRWVTREWLPCSQTQCGVGSQERLVQCMVLEASGRETMVPDQRCNSTIKPNHSRQCVIADSSRCDTHWEEDEWGECCSDEAIVRRVECINSNHITQPPFLCSHLHRNISLRYCTGGPCSNGRCQWVPKRWFSCNNTCGRGQQRRNAKCRNSDNRAVPSRCCQDQSPPQLLRDCHDDRANWCRPGWVTTSWNKCRGECGESGGEKTRSLHCWAPHRHGFYVSFPHSFCSEQDRPVTVENCTRRDPLCSNCHWVASNWSDCYCPAGARTRNVSCSTGATDCCWQRQPYKPTEYERCTCPTTATTPTPTPGCQESDSCCEDYQSVNCQQLKEDGHCSETGSNFARLLCCRTCST